MKKRLKWGSGILVVGVLAFGIWWIWGRTPAPLKVKAGVVVPTSMQEEVYATGTVVPVSLQEALALSPGRIAKVAVKVGDAVKAGQVLVTLDSTLADAQVAQAQAGVEAAQTNVNTAQTNLDELKKAQTASAASMSAGLSTGVAVSPSTMSQAEGVSAQSKAALKQAQAALKVAQVQQGQLVYKATIGGTVLEVNAQAGNLSPVQQPLAIVADLSQMNIEAQLNEVDAGKVKLGEKVTITSQTLGSASAQGTIVEIAPEAVTVPSVQGNASPTVGVKIRLDQVPTGLKPGYTVSLQIIVATKTGVLAVPQEALFQEGSKNYVYRIQAGRLHKTEVKIGIGDDINQEITSGLMKGDLVVLNPSSQYSEGMSVTPDTGSGGS